MLLENLEQGKGIPAGTKKENVEHLMDHLCGILQQKLKESYTWLAIAYAGVMAGVYGGDKRKNRRLKIRRMIQECAEFLSVPDPTANFPKRWEYHNLCYGFGACMEWEEKTGMDMETTAFFSFMAPKVEGKRIDKTPFNSLLNRR